MRRGDRRGQCCGAAYFQTGISVYVHIVYLGLYHYGICACDCRGCFHRIQGEIPVYGGRAEGRGGGRAPEQRKRRFRGTAGVLTVHLRFLT